MTSPGGTEVGRVSIRVVPDTSGFRARLRSDIEQAIRSLDSEIDIALNLDENGLRERVRTALAGLDEVVRIRLDIDQASLSGLRARVENATRGLRADIAVGFSTSVSQLRAELRSLVARAGRGIDTEVRVRYRDVGFGGGGGSLGGGFGGGGFSLMSVGRLAGWLLAAAAAAGPLALAGAAVTAAWGAVSTTLVGLPALIGAIGIPALTVSLGIDRIKQDLASLNPEIQNIRAVVSDAFGTSMTYVVTNLRFLLQRLVGSFDLVATRVGGAMARITSIWTNAANTELIRMAFVNAGGGVTLLSGAIEDLGVSMIKILSMRSAWEAFLVPIMIFGDRFRKMITDLSESGHLTNAFQGLQEVLTSLSEGFVDLVENGIKLFANAAPGVSDFLDDLTGFFNRFDWDSLGKSVGDVFKGVGETLENVPQETIDNIESAFNRLGKTFRDPEVQRGFQTLVDRMPDLIDGLSDLTKGFSDFVLKVDAAAKAIGPFTTKLEELMFPKGDGGGAAPEGFLQEFDQFLDESLRKMLGLTPQEYGDLVGDPLYAGMLEAAEKGKEGAAKIAPGIAEGLDKGKPAVQGAADGLSKAALPPAGVQEALGATWGSLLNGVGASMAAGLEVGRAMVLPKVDEVTKAVEPTPAQSGRMRNSWEQFLYDIGVINEDGLIRIFEQSTSGLLNISNAFGTGTAAIPGLVQTNLGPVGDAANPALQALDSNVATGWARTVGTTAAGVANVAREAGTVRTRIPAAIGDLGNLLYSSGQAVMNGFIRGIASRIGAAAAQAAAAARAVSAYFPRSPAEKGAFSGKGYTLFSGQALMKDWAKGMAVGAALAVSAANSAVAGVNDEFATVPNMAVSGYSSVDVSVSNSSSEDRMASAVHDALSEWTVVIDADGVAKMVNKSNLKRGRRG